MDDKIKTERDALEWLDRRIREEVELDGEMTNEHAIELAFIQRTLERFPPRNCDRFNSGDVKRDAQDAMKVMLDEGVAGIRGMAEYLLSPVRTEQKGEVK